MKSKKNNFAMSISVLGVVIGVPLIFVLGNLSTSAILEKAPYFLLIFITLAMAIYSATTSKLLYNFYEIDAPWYSWIPCFGELTLMDKKFLKVGVILYVGACVAGLMCLIPYTAFGFVSTQLAINLPFYFMVIAIAFLVGVQIVKGIGLIDCNKSIREEWEERNHTGTGIIGHFSFLGFIPYVRVLAIYGLNKPLGTMVTFQHETISASNDVELVEEEDD